MTLRERVARAIALNAANDCEHEEDVAAFVDRHWEEFATAADAAMGAHKDWLAEQGKVVVPREPTEDMLPASEVARHWAENCTYSIGGGPPMTAFNGYAEIALEMVITQARLEGAEWMREQAVNTVAGHGFVFVTGEHVADAIRALPLEPEAEDEAGE